MKTTVALLALALGQSAPAPNGPEAQAPAASRGKIEIVSVTGCLRESSPGAWTMTAATDPVPSSANAPQPKEIPAAAPAGKNSFKLIGVSEFNLPAHRDHTVVIKGLFIKADPASRINMTSVAMVAASCTAGAAK
jgi:hypothetical protein